MVSVLLEKVEGFLRCYSRGSWVFGDRWELVREDWIKGGSKGRRGKGKEGIDGGWNKEER